MMQSDHDQYIEDLYHQYFKKVFTCAKLIAHNRKMAEEIAQDVFQIAQDSR